MRNIDLKVFYHIRQYISHLYIVDKFTWFQCYLDPQKTIFSESDIDTMAQE